jgi:hypothetical protein
MKKKNDPIKTAEYLAVIYIREQKVYGDLYSKAVKVDDQEKAAYYLKLREMYKAKYAAIFTFVCMLEGYDTIGIADHQVKREEIDKRLHDKADY